MRMALHERLGPALAALLVLACFVPAPKAHGAPVQAYGAPAVAFFYAASPPIDELAAFDAVVLEPEHSPQGPPARPGTEWFAYVSVGEVQRSRPWFDSLPAAWQL